MTLRLLKALDFSPRLGLVTRTIGTAAVDLGHFAALFGLVFVGFALIGFINFGPNVLGFSRMGTAFESLFLVMVGFDMTIYLDMAKTPNATAGGFFFYIFYIVTSLILLNVLLAILVDSYADVKDKLQDADTMPEEIVKMVRVIKESQTGKPNSQILKDMERVCELIEDEKVEPKERMLRLPDFKLDR